MSENDSELCVFCQEPLLSELYPPTKVGPKGLKKIRECSIERGDGLITQLIDKEKIMVHIKCRKSYINNHAIKAYLRMKKKYFDSASSSFDFKLNCFICGTEASSAQADVQYVTDQLRDTVKEISKLRNDKFMETIIRRIEDVDLVGVGARYHAACYERALLPAGGARRRGAHAQTLPFIHTHRVKARARASRTTSEVSIGDESVGSAEAAAGASCSGGDAGDAGDPLLELSPPHPPHEGECRDPLMDHDDDEQPQPGPSTSSTKKLNLKYVPDAPLLTFEEEVERLLDAFCRERALWACDAQHTPRPQRLHALARVASVMDVEPSIAAALLIRYTKMFRVTVMLPRSQRHLSHWYNKMKFLLSAKPRSVTLQTEKMVVTEEGQEVLLEIKEEVQSDEEGREEANAEDLAVVDRVLEELAADCAALRHGQNVSATAVPTEIRPPEDLLMEPLPKRRRKVSVEVSDERPTNEKGTQTCLYLFSEKVQRSILESPWRQQFEGIAALIEKNCASLRRNQMSIQKCLEAGGKSVTDTGPKKLDQFGNYVAKVLKGLLPSDAAAVQLKITEFLRETETTIIHQKNLTEHSRQK